MSSSSIPPIGTESTTPGPNQKVAHNKNDNMANLHILDSHPLVASKLSEIRGRDVGGREFREGIKSLTSILIYEASRNLPTRIISSPISSSKLSSSHSPNSASTFNRTEITARVGLVPILRAGIGMSEAALDHFPSSPVYHLGLFREKTTLQVIEYYSKLPERGITPPEGGIEEVNGEGEGKRVDVDLVYLMDPMIATANTILAALHTLIDWGLPPTSIKVISVLGSVQGIERLREEFPEVEIYIASIDPLPLTSHGYIQPGLGDVGDRLFGTSPS